MLMSSELTFCAALRAASLISSPAQLNEHQKRMDVEGELSAHCHAQS